MPILSTTIPMLTYINRVTLISFKFHIIASVYKSRLSIAHGIWGDYFSFLFFFCFLFFFPGGGRGCHSLPLPEYIDLQLVVKYALHLTIEGLCFVQQCHMHHH